MLFLRLTALLRFQLGSPSVLPTIFRDDARAVIDGELHAKKMMILHGYASYRSPAHRCCRHGLFASGWPHTYA